MGRKDRILVEDEERFKHLQLMLVRNRTPDLIIELSIRERLSGLQALIR